jgi:hypothetical protein
MNNIVNQYQHCSWLTEQCADKLGEQTIMNNGVTDVSTVMNMDVPSSKILLNCKTIVFHHLTALLEQ